MKDSKPILFSGEMVRALLAGRKTQTRRIVRYPKSWLTPYASGDKSAAFKLFHTEVEASSFWNCMEGSPEAHWQCGDEWLPQNYQPGDRLWVKETFRRIKDGEIKDGEGSLRYGIEYRAGGVRWDDRETIMSGGWKDTEKPMQFENPPWKPSIFMRKSDSRITLEIVSIRVERVQEISEGDAKAEGVRDNSEPAWPHDLRLCPQCGGTGLRESLGCNFGVIEVDCANCDTYVKRFRILWEHINGPDSWKANPWVWVVSFKQTNQQEQEK